MADITVTAANVVSVSGAQNTGNLASTTITAGKIVYLNASNQWALAAANSTALIAGGGTTWGIALHAALASQPLAVQVGGVCGFGVVFTVGVIYVISATAGGIAPITDLVSTNYISILGIATTTSNLDMSTLPKTATGVVKP